MSMSFICIMPIISTVNIIIETNVVVQALRVNTLSKLTFADSKRFDALVLDVFPGVDVKGVEYEQLAEALKSAAQGSNLVIMDTQIKKALELYEQLKQRMGVVIIGPSGSGKSTIWKILRIALGKIGQTVKQYTMNPKAMPRTQVTMLLLLLLVLLLLLLLLLLMVVVVMMRMLLLMMAMMVYGGGDSDGGGNDEDVVTEDGDDEVW